MLLKFGFDIIDQDKAFVILKWAEEHDGQPKKQGPVEAASLTCNK